MKIFIEVTTFTVDKETHKRIKIPAYINVDHIIRIDAESRLDGCNTFIFMTDGDADVYCTESVEEVMRLITMCNTFSNTRPVFVAKKEYIDFFAKNEYIEKEDALLKKCIERRDALKKENNHE